MTGNIPSSSKLNTGKKAVIEDVEDEVDELSDSDFSKASTRVFDKIDHGKSSVLPSSTFFDLIETLGEGFHNDDLVGHMRKVDPG